MKYPNPTKILTVNWEADEFWLPRIINLIAYLSKKVLIKNNLTFDFALDGNEAIEKAQTTQYSLILMDIEMPILDGFEATIAIRNTENINQFTPIIALTASALSSIKENALHVGMNGFLSKPFTPDQLNELLNEFVCAK